MNILTNYQVALVEANQELLVELLADKSISIVRKIESLSVLVVNAQALKI
jgi:hypothetical protein